MSKLWKLKRRKLIGLAFLLVAAVCMVGVLIIDLAQPSRSVAAYCRVYAQEKMRLSAMSSPQGQYPSATFDVSVDNAGQIATSLGRLDRVAPNEIEPNVKTLQKLYQEVHDDPALDVQASLSGESIDNSLKTWTMSHCSTP